MTCIRIFTMLARVGASPAGMPMLMTKAWLYAGRAADRITSTTARTMNLGTAAPKSALDLNTKFFCTKKFTVCAAAVATRKLRKPHNIRLSGVV